MRNLFIITALVLLLGFSSLTFAQDHMDLYSNGPSGKEGVSDDIRGGEVESSSMSFYLNPVKGNTEGALRTVEESESDENTLLVFGVRL